jgi:hypothetical protein
MFRSVNQDLSKSTTVRRIAALRFVLVLMVSNFCFTEQAVGDDKSAHQRFVVEVSGVIRMNSVPAPGKSEMSRVEISSASEVVMAVSSTDEPASSSDVVFLLHSGQSCHLSIHRGSGHVRAQTVSLSGQPCLELSGESTPVLTITSI